MGHFNPQVKKILFVGNGINRVNTPYSWENLLQDLIARLNLGNQIRIQSPFQKPLTLFFEEIKLLYRDNINAQLEKEKTKKALDEIHKTLSTLIQEKYKTPCQIHRNIVTWAAVHQRPILTTNYDYTLEIACGNKHRDNSPFQERRYSVFRRRLCEGNQGSVEIWHLHGEVSHPRTLMLGHEHYAGYIQKLRNYLTVGVEHKHREERQKKLYLSPLKENPGVPPGEQKQGKQRQDPIYSWVDLFLFHEVHMMGFSLDFSEIHLWWLIVNKMWKRKEYPWGNLVYHYVYPRNKRNNTEIPERDQAKISILKSYGAIVKVHKESYEQAYQQILEEL